MDVHLGSAQAIYYMGQTRGFEDVRLVSSQGQYHSINSCIFASMSTACFDIVNQVYNDPFAGEEFFVTTEFSSELLQTFIEFANSGTIRKQSTFDLENDLQLNQVFAAFGINLNQLSFTTEACPDSSETKPFLNDQQSFGPICPDISELIKEEEQWIKAEPDDEEECFKTEPNDDDDEEWFNTEPDEDDDEEDQPLSLKRKKKSSKTKKSHPRKRLRPSKLERMGEGKGSYRYYWFPQDESLREEWKDYQHKCNQCVRGFNSKFEFRQHLRRHKSKNVENIWFCVVCEEGFKSYSSLKSHTMQEHSDGENLTCPKCNFKAHIRGYGRMETHLKKHEIMEKCVECGQVVKDYEKDQKKGHNKRHGIYHDGKCRLCPELEAFSSHENYMSHLNEKHDGKLQFKCGVCPEYFDTKEKMKIHKLHKCQVKKEKYEKTVASSQVICNFCGKLLKNTTLLRYHEQEYHGEFDLPCDVCDRVLKHPLALERHKLIHRRYTCDICGKSGLLSKFKKHMETYHTEEHLKPYVCAICKPVKGFAFLKNYNEHMNIHNGVKPCKCPHCPAAFASQGTLGGHIRGTHKDKKRRSK